MGLKYGAEREEKLCPGSPRQRDKCLTVFWVEPWKSKTRFLAHYDIEQPAHQLAILTWNLLDSGHDYEAHKPYRVLEVPYLHSSSTSSATSTILFMSSHECSVKCPAAATIRPYSGRAPLSSTCAEGQELGHGR